MQNSTLQITSNSDFTNANVALNNQYTKGTVAAGSTQNIDYTLVDDCFITGGELITYGANFGDTVLFQVVDVNNILGKGENFVCNQYDNKILKNDTYNQQQSITKSLYPAKIIAGLTLRLVYSSTGLVPVQVGINYDLHKALY